MRRLATFLLDGVLRSAGSVLYGLFRVLGWPFVTVTGGIIGRLMYWLSPRKRTEVEESVSRLFSRRTEAGTVRDIVRRSFQNYYTRHVETLFFGSLDRRTIDAVVEVRGLEHLDEALRKGKGVMLLLAHFGSFLLPLPFLGFRGYRVNQVTGRQVHSSLVAERIWTWRKNEADRLPVRFIQVGRFLRPIFEAFGRNELVAIAFDGRDGTTWADADFFGSTVRFSTGPFDLARRTGATVIPTFMVRRNDGRHTLVLEEPFRLATEADERTGAAADTRNFARLFAGYVERYPCHFGMVLHTLYERPDRERTGPPLRNGE